MAGDTLTVTLSQTDNPNATLYGYATDNNRSAAVFNGVIQGPVDRLTYAMNRLGEMIGTPVTISGVDATTDLITTSGAHSLVANDPVRVKALGAGAVPGGLSAGTVYYVLYQSTTTVKLSLTPGGAVVDITSAGTGPLYLYKITNAGLYVVSGGEASSLTDAVVLVNGTQTVEGAKTFADITVDSYPKLTSRSATRSLGSIFTETSGTGGSARMPFSVVSGTQYDGELELPHGQTLTAIAVHIDPVDVGVLPATFPAMLVKKIDALTTGAGTNTATATDDAHADVASYNAFHSFGASGLSEVIDRTRYRYYVRIENSSGGTITMHAVRATCTVTGMREWA